MAYGLKIKNDALDIQIDSTYPNYSLWEHGESVSTVDQGTHHTATITFATATAQPPLIAIKPSSSDYCGALKYTTVGANYTGIVVFSEDKVVTFDWMVFVPTVVKSAAAYGLRVYDSSEDLVFDSGYGQLIILDVDIVSPAYNAVVTITHPSDANAYFIMAPWGLIQHWITTPGGGEFWAYVPMYKYLSATTVSFGGVEYVNDTAPFGWDDDFGYWASAWTILTVKKAFV